MKFVNKYDHIKLKDFVFSFEDLFNSSQTCMTSSREKILLCFDQQLRDIAKLKGEQK